MPARAANSPARAKMANLQKQFGRLVAAHRHRAGITQDVLAERTKLSVNMIAKIETGATGVSFAAIERIAKALNVDPAELFSTEVPAGALQRRPLTDLTAMLAGLSPQDLLWIKGIIVASLKRRQ